MLLYLAAPEGEAAKAGPWWLVTVLALAIILFFLARSMFTHLRRAREQFPDAELDRPAGDEGGKPL